MNPQSSVRLFKKILILEVLGVLGAYTLYYKMNSSEDFRYKMKRRCPSVLEVYYKSNEWAGIYGLKELDEDKWLTKKTLKWFVPELLFLPDDAFHVFIVNPLVAFCLPLELFEI